MIFEFNTSLCKVKGRCGALFSMFVHFEASVGLYKAMNIVTRRSPAAFSVACSFGDGLFNRHFKVNKVESSYTIGL